MSEAHASDVRSGDRFEFGRNWSRFLSELDESRVAQAEQSLQTMLGVEDLGGKRFLDIGSGSGLFSLAARRLGAEVRSFDFDPDSVACTRELRGRYFPNDSACELRRGRSSTRTSCESWGSGTSCTRGVSCTTRGT